MNRKHLLLSILFLFLSACTRAIGGIAPTDLPVDFPSPAPGSTPLCQPADLGISSNSTGASGAITLGITLTNKSKNPCALANPPQVTLLDNSNKVLDVKVSNNPLDAQTAVPFRQTELHAGESAILSLVWSNTCQALPKDQLTVRVALTDGQNLDVPMELLSEPRCDAKNEPSTLVVGPYSYPP